MSKGKLTATAMVLAVVIAGVYGSPYWAVYQMHSAVRERDADKLATYIDFPSVRESLKSQMMASFMESAANDLKENPFAGLAGVFASTLVDKLVDSLVTPDGFARLLEKGKLEDPTKATSDTEQAAMPVGQSTSSANSAWQPTVSQGYKDLNLFEVHMTPPGEPKPFVLKLNREGLVSWRVRSVRLPL